ncbi:MAG: CPBP family glutamic-type intramembrane protease [Pseudomonadota bacterium]
MSETTSPARTPARTQLWVEFVLLFGGVPLLMLVFLGQYSLFLTVWILAALSLGLLWLTPGWELDQLWKKFPRRDWWVLGVFSLATALTCLTTAYLVVPERMFGMVIYRPELWLAIMLLYPPVSAWPQELIYRSLFFERYGSLFPNATWAIGVNGAAFALGHLFFQNPITILMTGAAGAVIAWAYLRNRSLWMAWALHSVGGILVFTSGLGIFFYHGAIGATP